MSPSARIPRPVIARSAATRQSVPRPLSQLRCQLPHRGSQDQARGPQRPLPPPLGEVPPQGAERARIPRPVIARRGKAPTRQSVPPPSQSAPLPAPPQGEPRPGPRTPTTLASPLGGGAPAGGGEGPPPLAKFYIICYNPPKRCSGGGWPLLSQGEAMLLKASSYPVARR